MAKAVAVCVLASMALSACGGGGDSSSAAGTGSSTGSSSSSSGSSGGSSSGGSGSSGPGSSSSGGTSSGTTTTGNLPAAGYNGGATVPADAAAVDSSHPDHVIGTGTAASCTSAAVVSAVAAGGVITFNCGASPVTIPMAATAQIFNNTTNTIVIDGGGLVTLDGQGQRRILYMNTCDPNLVWTSSTCQNQQYPQLTVQNLTFINGNASSVASDSTSANGPEGGAIFARGGRIKVVNSRFFNNVCAGTGPDTAGGAIYATSQYQNMPLYVVNSTFGGKTTDGAASLANSCSNGGAVGSIGVSWSVINTRMTDNKAVGNGGNPAASGTPGGGSGGAIYNDGNTMTLTVAGSLLSGNSVNAYGSAIFFVSDNNTGNIVISGSSITGNTGGSWYPVWPQISTASTTPITVTNSTITQ